MLEPVLYPDQTLHLIELTHEFVDYYIVGKLNYFREVEAKIDWPQFRKDAEKLLQSYGKMPGKMPGKGYSLNHQLRDAK